MPETNDIQSTALRGHRELNLAEKALIAEVDVISARLRELTLGMEPRSDIDKRALSIARTHLQTGLMWLTRSIAKPDRF